MTDTERPLHYFIAEADDYRAWAGCGPYAEALLASGRTDAMTEFQSRVSEALYEHAGDFDKIDTESIAREVLTDLAIRCDECLSPFDGPMFDEYDIGDDTWILCQDCGADVARIRDREAND